VYQVLPASKKAFSIIELMIALIILGLLLALATPVYKNYLVRSKYTSALLNLNSLKTAIVNFRITNGDLRKITKDSVPFKKLGEIDPAKNSLAIKKLAIVTPASNKIELQMCMHHNYIGLQNVKLNLVEVGEFVNSTMQWHCRYNLQADKNFDIQKLADLLPSKCLTEYEHSAILNCDTGS